MGTQNKGVKYQSISFDKQFIAEIKKYIEDKKQYRSIADFSRSAIREKISRDTLNTVLEIDSDKMSKRIKKLEESIENLRKDQEKGVN